ncbi:MAG: hypothetical protein HY518_05875 [Candidatus Aenigmarchaeota archaeon]|nr:hypothetical protein [Candidatus Aenigmarchaeota archaeon]
MDERLGDLLNYLEKYYPDYVKEAELKGFGFRKELLAQAAAGQFIESAAQEGSNAYRLSPLGYILISQIKMQRLAETSSPHTIGGYDNSATYFEDIKMWVKIFIVMATASVFLGVLVALRVFSVRLV